MTAATNPPSPPSARDFNVYEHVAVVRTTWKESRKIAYLDQAMKIPQRALEMDLPLPMCMLAEDDDESDAEDESAANDATDEVRHDDRRDERPGAEKSDDEVREVVLALGSLPVLAD
jgi:hypothetical protein